MYAFNRKIWVQKGTEKPFSKFSRFAYPEGIIKIRKMAAEDYYVRARHRYSKGFFGGAFADITRAISLFETELEKTQQSKENETLLKEANILLSSALLIRRRIYKMREDENSAAKDTGRALELNPNIA